MSDARPLKATYPAVVMYRSFMSFPPNEQSVFGPASVDLETPQRTHKVACCDLDILDDLASACRPISWINHNNVVVSRGHGHPEVPVRVDVRSIWYAMRPVDVDQDPLVADRAGWENMSEI
jgi:hypothetical protein